MRHFMIAIAAVASLAACSPSQVQTTRTTLDQVRLFCAVKDATVAISTASGTPILAQGQPKAYVDAACALAGGIAVSPPAAPVQTVTIPPITIPVRS